MAVGVGEFLQPYPLVVGELTAAVSTAETMASFGTASGSPSGEKSAAAPVHSSVAHSPYSSQTAEQIN